MDKKTKGSWLIHHTNKLQGITDQSGYEKTYLAGKAGILLAAISSDKQISINDDRLNVLARASNISITFELPKLIDVLRTRQLISVSSGGIEVLGLTTATTLQHTADIFDALTPETNEVAAIALAEHASIAPVLEKEISEYLSDTYKIANNDVKQTLFDAGQIGFVDTEIIDNSKKLLFNGNLFRRKFAEKIKIVLDALKPDEKIKITDLTEKLRTQACVSVDSAKKLLGDMLFQKVNAIGLFDISVVSNSTEDAGFVTLPSAFSKYSNSMVDDAFDLAKAFVSSVTYGMTQSSYARGQIQMVDALLSALVRGERVGPVQAIKEDYKLLELKGVVEVSRGTKKGRTGPMLRLLKKEVGELALQAIRQGDVSEYSLSVLPSAAITNFKGPEHNREKVRRQLADRSPKATNDMLSILRTGGGL